MFCSFVLSCFSLRELIPRSTCTSESDFSPSGGDWLDMALVAYGGTFMDSEVNELRALKKAVVFCLLLIPYWMIYTQVTENEVLRHVSNSTAKHLLVM